MCAFVCVCVGVCVCVSTSVIMQAHVQSCAQTCRHQVTISNPLFVPACLCITLSPKQLKHTKDTSVNVCKVTCVQYSQCTNNRSTHKKAMQLEYLSVK